ncbi:hypothetical protein ACFLRA_01690 [Bdellovibrionota bacterium]
MKKTIALLFVMSLLIISCRQFEQRQTSGTLYSHNDQFRIDYSLSYSTGDGLGEDTPEKTERLIEQTLNQYHKGYTKDITRNVYLKIEYEEAVVRLIHFTLQATDSGKFFGDVYRTYGVFEFKEIEQKARDFFANYGYLLTGGGRIHQPGARYIDFTLTEDYIDRVVINGFGRDGTNGTCRCYRDRDGNKHCYGTDGTDGEDGADVSIYYPPHLANRLHLIEVNNEGGFGGRGGFCSDGPDGRPGYSGRRGQVFYRQLP